jgi:hypothetical protein
MVCFAFASRRFSSRVPLDLARQSTGLSTPGKGLGLTGLEPVTLRLSSACSNQLSYRPGVRFDTPEHAPVVSNFRGAFVGQAWLFLMLQVAKRVSSKLREQRNLLEVRGLEPLTYSLQSYRSTN